MFVKRFSLLFYTLLWMSVNSFPAPQPITESISEVGSAPLYIEDMVLHPCSAEYLVGPRSFLTGRGKWPVTTNDCGEPLVIIPYVKIDLDPFFEDLVAKTIQEFTEKSCIRWVPRGDEDYYLTITGVARDNSTKDYCSADVGYTKSLEYQKMILPDGCVNDTAAVPHEMMHVLGFIHEYQRIDRDCYITISDQFKYDKPNFGLYSYLPTDDTFPYDPHSIMHYRDWGQFTSIFGDTLGNSADSLDEMDWMKLNYMYCDGPHICDVDQEACQKHKDVQAACGYPFQTTYVIPGNCTIT